jgi:uncharacterized membrane protein
MSAGLPISLLPTPEYMQGSLEVQRIYQTADAAEARDLAKARGIQYLYVDEEDRQAYATGMAKFDAPYFERAYDRRGITIFRVR